MLFRKEVIEQLGQGQAEGKVLIRSPWLLWFFSTTAFVGTCCLLLLIFTGTYTQRIKLSGQLAYDRSPIFVRTTVHGRVNKLLVKNGSFVKRGETICVLTPMETVETQIAHNTRDTDKGNSISTIEQRLQEQNLQLQDLTLRVRELATQKPATSSRRDANKKDALDGLARDDEGNLKAIEMQSPIDGILLIDEAMMNAQLQSGSPLFRIVPPDSRLRAELLFPASALPYIQIGLQLNLRYAAFPYQKFGQYQGTLAQVSNISMSSTNTSATEKQYKAYVNLSQQEVAAYGKNIALREGLEVEVDYPTGQRSIVEWIFEPLLALKGHL